MVRALWEQYKKKLIPALIILAFAGGGSAVSNVTNEIAGVPEFGASYADAQWKVINKFEGYQTKLDPTKISEGGAAQGQNTSVNNGDRISIRTAGYDIFPTGATQDTENDPVTSLHTFRLRSGENILMRAWGGKLDWFDEVGDTWTELEEGYATSTDFGFADYNINADLHSYVYFGNAVQPFSRWNGAYDYINGARAGGEDRVIVDSIDGFAATGSIVYCGVKQAYTYLSATTTAFVLNGTATACADNSSVAQAVETYANHPRGNIYLVANNRLFVSGVASTTQAVFFSKYGDATDFTSAAIVTDTTAESSGIFNLGEGGGGVTGMALDENSIYIFKKSIIYKATLNDSLYTLQSLKPFDGKSQTIGAVNQRSIFAGGNGVFFITPDKQIMNLTRVEQVDYPQVIPISDIILPTVSNMHFASSTGIVFQDKAYFSVKSTSDAPKNDTVLVYNIPDKNWETPIVGWNARDFAIYDSGTEPILMFGDASNANVYQVNETPLDYVYGVTANWRTKQFDFGMPQSQKEMVDFFVEGYIAPNTELTISLLLDEDGYTQTYSAELLGTESAYIYNSQQYNLFGLTPFGTNRFGSNADQSGKKKFRVYLNKSFRIAPFYNAQVEFASDGENQQWEILALGMKVRESTQPEKTSLMRAFQ